MLVRVRSLISVNRFDMSASAQISKFLNFSTTVSLILIMGDMRTKNIIFQSKCHIPVAIATSMDIVFGSVRIRKDVAETVNNMKVNVRKKSGVRTAMDIIIYRIVDLSLCSTFTCRGKATITSTKPQLFTYYLRQSTKETMK